MLFDEVSHRRANHNRDMLVQCPLRIILWDYKWDQRDFLTRDGLQD